MLFAFMATVSQARASGYVALKSIIAYRSRLTIAPVSRENAAAAFGPLKRRSASCRPCAPRQQAPLRLSGVAGGRISGPAPLGNKLNAGRNTECKAIYVADY